ncbi:hypothetical protein F5Y17DRAFT_443170 [Xylariaceae sp. FL0594]|nr:hypothetical protein F5Y17DRAFT_443170 [Xylariaceae sp. FL0594]
MGSLEDADILRREAAWADLVLHAADASDHVGAAVAISEGLRFVSSGQQHHDVTHPTTASNPRENKDNKKKKYWLHTGGNGILTYFDTSANRIGFPPSSPEKVFDDLEGVAELTSLPDEAFHRNVDKIVLECGTVHADKGVRTAIVCPPTIYGNGRGPVSGRSRQCYGMAKFILTKGQIPIVGTGQSKMNNVHIYDLTEAYIALIEAAVSGNDSAELWGERGYHFVVTGEHTWGPLARLMGRVVHDKGLSQTEELEEYKLTRDEAVEYAGFEALSWGLNALTRARRLEKYLGWKPRHPSLEEEVPGIVEAEAKRLGLLPY